MTGKEWSNPDPVIQICTKDEITRVMAQINEKQDTLKQMPAVKAAYDKAVDLVSAVITPKEEIDAATADLKELLDNNGVYTDVANVQTLINVIGEVTLESLPKIEAAETANEALTTDHKKYVTEETVAKLTAARAKYDRGEFMFR